MICLIKSMRFIKNFHRIQSLQNFYENHILQRGIFLRMKPGAKLFFANEKGHKDDIEPKAYHMCGVGGVVKIVPLSARVKRGHEPNLTA